MDDYGNPSSKYDLGIKSKEIIDQARKNIQKFINAKSIDDILFTSSASASITLAITKLKTNKPYYVLYSPIAHKSMILSCKSVNNSKPLCVDHDGFIDLEYLTNLLLIVSKNYTPLVCVDCANSEIGTIQDLYSISKITKEYGGLFFGDATGYISSIPLDVQNLQFDLLAFSGHKLGGLKGCGVLYKNSNVNLCPLIYGTQEQGIIGGTENVLGIASLGEAVKYYSYSPSMSENRDYVYQYIINNIPNCYLVGSKDKRLPNNLYFCFKGIEGESLMFLLDINNIQVSTGSACNSNNLTDSITLSAIGMDKNDMHSCIRMTFNGNETKNELDYVCNILKMSVNKLRKLNKGGCIL